MNLDIPAKYQNIAVLFSGGADSTAILYEVASKYPDRKICAITAGCSYIKHRVHLNFARNMFEALVDALPPGAINEHIITYHDDRVGHHCGQYMNENRDNYDVWIIGQNAAPPKGSIATDRNGRVWDLYESCPLDSRKEISESIWGEWNDHVTYKPLLHIDKKGVFSILKGQGILDQVLEFSRSCPKTYTDETIQNFKHHCDDCWWCLERRWGLSDIDKLAESYNDMSATYDQKYVDGDNNPYMYDEAKAAEHWLAANLSGKIVSLGCGTGQDIEILNHPDPQMFRGVDFSSGMLEKAKSKFPDYEFWLHDCRYMLRDHHEDADVLVSMFGTANYLGYKKLIAHYKRLNCSQAFFVFYDENYNDGISDETYLYTKDKLKQAFGDYNPTVSDLWDGSNYYVVWWNENSSV